MEKSKQRAVNNLKAGNKIFVNNVFETIKMIVISNEICIIHLENDVIEVNKYDKLYFTEN